MNSYIIASTRKDAGKTSLLVGIARATGKKFGYLKPLGDRFLYRKKRLWDYDAALLVKLFGLDEEPEAVSIGFDHSKLRYMYDQDSITAKLNELIEMVGKDKDALYIECGKGLAFGASVYLDPLTISKATGLKVVIVAGGEEDEIADDLAFLKRFISAEEAHVGGVIINKVKKPDDFKETHLEEIEQLGIPVFGIVPYEPELTTLSVSTVADKLFARVIAGEGGLNRTIRNVLVGAMSVGSVLANPLFNKPDKLIITPGDRSDMILAALDAGGTSCILLTNNIVPPANVITRATEQGVPILLVPHDTYTTAMQVDRIEPLLTPEDTDKVALLTRLVIDNIDLNALGAL
ncbi:AAA family ATPase [Candidatus Bipolaricaulota bacterium]|nr:AAA family ATPase [Candidatus Bipolaricaulota bacterium]